MKSTWRFVLSALGAGALAACNNGVDLTTSSSASTSSGHPTLDCGLGEHADASGTCASSLSFNATMSLISPAREDHATFVAESQAGAFLYVVGGADGALVLSDVQRAQIHLDGSLGAWEPAGPDLPQPRAGHALTVIGRSVVAVGGFSASGLTSTSIVARLDSITGKLGTWTPGPKLPEGIMHSVAVASGTSLYLLGGLVKSGSTSAVLRATVDASGVSPFAIDNALPGPRSDHAAFVHEHAIYVVGGMKGDPTTDEQPLGDVLRAQIAGDGSLGAFRQVGNLPSRVHAHATFFWSDHLYVLGGLEAGAPTNQVQRARIEDDGTASAFELAAILPSARARVHQAPVYKQWTFFVGGSSTSVVGHVDRGTFD